MTTDPFLLVTGAMLSGLGGVADVSSRRRGVLRVHNAGTWIGDDLCKFSFFGLGLEDSHAPTFCRCGLPAEVANGIHVTERKLRKIISVAKCRVIGQHLCRVSRYKG